MQNTVPHNKLSVKQQQSLITAQPLFAALKPLESQQLGALMVEKYYLPNEIIVLENAPVDSIAIIVSGYAEVSRDITIKHTISKTPLAMLGPGETIGLNDTGFFSDTGNRTATVTALSKMRILFLTLENLQYFLQRYPAVLSGMREAITLTQRMQVIKQSLPFSRLSQERLHWLAKQIKEVSLPAGTVIFRQGDEGNRCYLICSGQIEIIQTQPDKSERRLAVLKSPTLFGEATLITRATRNATARTITACDLLVLKHSYLAELLESEKNVAKMFMDLMVNRSRPLHCSGVTVHQRYAADNQLIVILKNTRTRRYFKLSEQGFFIWQQLDGQHTMQEITLAFADAFNIFAPDTVAALISKLAKAGYLQNIVLTEPEKAKQSVWSRGFSKLRQALESRIALGDVDKWLTLAYQYGIKFLFTRLGKLILALIAISGVFVFGFTTRIIIETFQIMPHTWLLFIALIPAVLFSTLLHELGHAFMTKAYGYEVHYMGIGWYWFRPVAFTDTSDMWLSTRGPRTAVNLAGVYSDIIVAGISVLLVLLIANPYIQAFFWLFTLLTYASAFRMMNPLQELDGYYVLMDLLERPQLRQTAVLWLVKEFPKVLRRPTLIRQHLPEAYYWLACIIFLIGVSLLTLFVQTFILKILGIKPANIFVSLSLPIFVALLSSLGIIADIRKHSE